MTSALDIAPIHLAQLEAALRTAQPGVLLVPPWLLQAVIAQDLNLPKTELTVPDEQLYSLPREKFLRFIADRDLPMPAGEVPSEQTLILLERPDAEWLATTPANEALGRYWRLLARVLAESRIRSVFTALPDGVERSRAVADRVAQIGLAVFNEARFVLIRERRLEHAPGDLEVYVKFAAALVEIRGFSPSVLPHVFPSIVDPDQVSAIINFDVGADVISAARPAGAIDPEPGVYEPLGEAHAQRTWWSIARRWLWPKSSLTQSKPSRRKPSKTRRDRLLSAAEKAAELGNHVRAAILYVRAAVGSGGDLSVPGQAHRALSRLVERLTKALELSGDQATDWTPALRPLLRPAATGWWSAEARLLYDLQKVCFDRERDVYSIHVVEWLLERCRRPLFRPLPNQQLSLATRHLNSAIDRLPRCRVTAKHRELLDRLLHEASHGSADRLREALGPRIAGALESAGLHPTNTVEEIAKEKIVHELLDDIIEDGYLTFAGVRDSISRNELRCKDLETAAEWFGYDQLMKLDRRMSDALDGVYRRGEIYRYAFQKLSSWLFASAIGRMLTKTVILPIAGAYLVLEGIQHTVGVALEKLFDIWVHLLPMWSAPDPEKDYQAWTHYRPEELYTNPSTWSLWVITALLFFSLINLVLVRRAIVALLAVVIKGLSFVLTELPERLMRNPIIRAILFSRVSRTIARYGIKPLLFVGIAWAIIPRSATPEVHGVTFGLVFLLANLILNSPTGRALEQVVLHGLRVGWVRFTADVLDHAIRGMVRYFEKLVETVDRMLYAVDEWLRFRAGDARRSLVSKAVLGVVWFYIAYIARFAITLLVEPQINPIKHFPVVTVSHKLLLPMIPSLAQGLQAVKVATSSAEAKGYATLIMACIPGIFGFLAWELKENWKLYRANLPRRLKPVHFGSHGESVAQLLRPGFHSGTLPKAYQRIRRAHRTAMPALEGTIDPTEFPLSVRKQLAAVHHVDEAIEGFVERGFLSLVNRHPAFAQTPLSLAGIHVGVTRIAIDLTCADLGPQPIAVEFDQVFGWIVGDIRMPHWTARLDQTQSDRLAFALRGLFQLAGADLVRNDIDRLFAPRRLRWSLRAKTLLVASLDQPDVEWEYPLDTEQMRPRLRSGSSDLTLPILHQRDLLLEDQPIGFDEWVAAWDAKPEERRHPGAAVEVKSAQSIATPV